MYRDVYIISIRISFFPGENLCFTGTSAARRPRRPRKAAHMPASPAHSHQFTMNRPMLQRSFSEMPIYPSQMPPGNENIFELIEKFLNFWFCLQDSRLCQFNLQELNSNKLKSYEKHKISYVIRTDFFIKPIRSSLGDRCQILNV